MRWLVTALAVLSGCVTPLSSLTRTTEVTVDAARFELKSEPAATVDEARVRGALLRATPKLARWGVIGVPVTVKVAPSHEALERAVGRRGFDWLRAWAQYDELIIQAPSTWAVSDADVDELVAHELTHCLTFQASGTRATWAAKAIPLWFREGLAIVTADQGLRYPTLEDLADWLQQHPELDVFAEAEALSRDAYAQIYGLAYHATRFFLRRHGDKPALEALSLMQQGDDFEGAFGRATGTTPKRFEADFLNYVRFRAFRGFGLTPKSRRLLPELRAP